MALCDILYTHTQGHSSICKVLAANIIRVLLCVHVHGIFIYEPFLVFLWVVSCKPWHPYKRIYCERKLHSVILKDNRCWGVCNGKLIHQPWAFPKAYNEILGHIPLILTILNLRLEMLGLFLETLTSYCMLVFISGTNLSNWAGCRW